MISPAKNIQQSNADKGLMECGGGRTGSQANVRQISILAVAMRNELTFEKNGKAADGHCAGHRFAEHIPLAPGTFMPPRRCSRT